MELSIRRERPEDYSRVEEVTREAFWNLYVPGCDEHYLSHIMRSHRDFLPDLSYVAEMGGNIIGSILYTRSSLLGENHEEVEIVSFGPLCVHPDYQRQGVGTALINRTKELVMQRNIPAIAIFGDPHNYCKHGFKNGIDYLVSDREGRQPLGLLVLELEPGFFGKVKWTIKQSDVFDFDRAVAAEFDGYFEKKEKRKQYSQELFAMQIRAFLN